MRCLLKGGTYFNVNTHRCGTYWWAVLIWGPVLIRGNMVITINSNVLAKVDKTFLNINITILGTPIWASSNSILTHI